MFALLPFEIIPRKGIWYIVIEVVRTLLRFIYTHGWIFTTYLIYIVHVIRFHQVNEFFFDHYVHEFSARKLRLVWLNLQKMRGIDQQLLGILPYVWTTNVFFKSFVNAVGSRVNPHSSDSSVDFLLQYMIIKARMSS